MADSSTRLEAKIDRILEELPTIKSDLRLNTEHTRRNTESLQEHMEQTMILKRELAREKESTDIRLKPLERAHWAWGVVGKAILATAGILGTIATILRLVLQ